MMAYFTCALINLGAYYIDFAHSVKIASTWKNLTDTAIIEMPRNITNSKGTPIYDCISRGDAVKIQLGYNNNLVERFTGYIDGVKPNNPVQIFCQDEMWKWKQVPVAPKTFTNGTLDQILQYAGFNNYELLGNVSFQGNFIIDRTVISAAGVLERLRKLFCPSFFRNGKLYVGKPYNTGLSNTINFAFNYNIISHNLEYKFADEVKILVRFESKKLSGKTEIVTVGDNTGETHTITDFNVPKSEMLRRANEYLQQLKFDGWHGKFKTFGEPIVQHGDIINLIDPINNEKSGKYYAERVEVLSDTKEAYKQEITIGLKAV
jgi:hypothetical protein